MAKLALALLAAPAVAFVAPGQQSASKVVVSGDIGVDPGPITPSGLMWEDQEGLARRRAVEIKHGRISMMAFLGMMVQELGITFPGSLTLDGPPAAREVGFGQLVATMWRSRGAAARSRSSTAASP